MKIYPSTYTPSTANKKPTVTEEKKASVIESVNAHMSENRGYALKELIDFVQKGLHAEDIHVRDKDVKQWLIDLDTTWGWKPTVDVAKEE